MARRRVVDWKKLSQKFRRKGWQYTLTWEGILGCVDDFGLCLWSPLTIGSLLMEKEINDRKIAIVQVERIMEEFATGTDPQILTWESSGDRYLAVTKHQPYQRVRQPGNADCPCPPPEILRSLAPATRTLITENLQKFTTVESRDLQNNSVNSKSPPNLPPHPPLVPPLVEVEDESRTAANAVRNAQEHFWKRLRQKTGMEAPEFSWGQAGKFFASRLKKGDTLADFTTSTDLFFDGYIRNKSAANFAHYQRVYNALCEQLIKGGNLANPAS